LCDGANNGGNGNGNGNGNGDGDGDGNGVSVTASNPQFSVVGAAGTAGVDGP
jgi:hypothetical protein